MANRRFVNHKLVAGFTAKTEALAAYRLVIVTSSDDESCEYPAAEYDPCIGVTAAAAAQNEPVDVVLSGIALVQVDGNAANIAVGDSIVAHTATGYGRKAAGGAAGNRAAIGVAMAASTADDDVIPVLLSPHTVYFAS